MKLLVAHGALKLRLHVETFVLPEVTDSNLAPRLRLAHMKFCQIGRFVGRWGPKTGDISCQNVGFWGDFRSCFEAFHVQFSTQIQCYIK